jgi:hypothetical protein
VSQPWVTISPLAGEIPFDGTSGTFASGFMR